MAVYIVVYCVLLLGARPFRRSSWWLWVTLAFFALLIGFRGLDVGADTREYYGMWSSIKDYGYRGYPEPLYGYLNQWAARLGFSFSWSQVSMFMLAFVPLGVSIQKNSADYGVSVFLLFALYLCLYAMNITRQMLSAFLVASMYPLLQKNGIKTIFWYGLVVLIGMELHQSTVFLLALLAVPFIKARVRVRRDGVLVTLIIIASIVMGVVMPEDFFISLYGKYDHYVGNEINHAHEFAESVFLSIYWSILFLMMYHLSDNEYKNSCFYWITLIGTVLGNILLRQSLGLRMQLFFNMAYIFAVPIAFARQKASVSRRNKLIVLVYVSIFFLVFLSINSASVVPYSLFQDE